MDDAGLFSVCLLRKVAIMNRSHALDRRELIAWASTTAVAAAVVSESAVTGLAQEAKMTADQYIQGKDRRLIVHSTKTGEIETPLELLRQHRHTPKSLLFVRSNQVLAETLTVAPAMAPDWTIELKGLLEKPVSLTVAQLEKLPQRDVELVIQCSGNSRSRYAESVKAEGVPWKNGAMGNVVVRGVALADALEACGAKIKAEAKYLTVEGKDVPLMPNTPDFEHSVPLADALQKSLLVLAMNGEPLPKVHGGPVRFVIPGYYATMNVKWVSGMTFAAGETTNYHHVDRYRTPRQPLKPGDPFRSTLDNSEPNWNMKIKSVIFAPLDGAKVNAGNVEVSGVAWNDGVNRIVAVEVSTDDGATWRRAKLTNPMSPYAWHPWKIDLNLPRGATKILSRAIDAAGNSQPLDGTIHWNPAGYAWNGVDAVRVDVG